jgi:hypothetical protein
VDHPEQVRVEETQTSDGVVLRLSVAKEDVGKSSASKAASPAPCARW